MVEAQDANRDNVEKVKTALAKIEPKKIEETSPDEKALDIKALMAIGFVPPIEDGTLIDKDTYYNNMVKLLESGEIDPTQSPALFGFLNNTDFVNDISMDRLAAAALLSPGMGYGAPGFTPADLRDTDSPYNKAIETVTKDIEIDLDTARCE